MKMLITGASGLVGTALGRAVREAGGTVAGIGRRARAPGDIAWDPQQFSLPREPLEGADAVVNLAGENLGAHRWTPDAKARIRQSRVQGTRLLCTRLAELERPPAVLVSASAVGYYGAGGDVPLSEEAGSGQGFLAEVCRQWEEATEPARRAGIRVVRLRLGVVISRHGGALPRLKLPFLLGVGGRLGSGRQGMSWIHLDDLVRAILHVVRCETMEGPVNAVSPEPVTNAEFTRTLASVLRRPAVLPVPAFALRLVLGEMADEMLLTGALVRPGVLLSSGFAFARPSLREALEAELARD